MQEKMQRLETQLAGLQQKYQETKQQNQQLTEKLKHLNLLYKMSLAFSHTFDLRDLFRTVKTIFRNHFEVDQFSLMVFDEPAQCLRIQSAFGIPDEVKKQMFSLTNKDNFTLAVQKVKPFYIHDMAQFPGYRFHMVAADHPVGSFVSIPLVGTGEHPIGLLNLQRAAVNGFKKNEIQLFQKIAQQTAQVLDKLLLFQHTKTLSLTDELTGVYNRRYFNQRFERELLRAQRYAHALTVILFDMDHFKSYNDTQGHLMGDEVLRRLTRGIDAIIRKTDIFARYGGEEFVLILPEITKVRGLQVAEKIRQAVENTPFVGGSQQPLGKISISVGVATYPDDATDAAGLLDLADKGLYTVKSSSRNAVGYCVKGNPNTFQICSPKILNDLNSNPGEALPAGIKITRRLGEFYPANTRFGLKQSGIMPQLTSIRQ
ncbi:sensor domain-containing diguanylate cyclase [candidate division KSB1 bacterium]|nr:sensor domain-containing diguanylate cyclase [candidate division KSB1 bacterium]